MNIRRGLAVAALVGCAAPAWAHSPIAGIGNFYNGALHPFVSPAHLVALLALGLWLGQRGLASAKQPLLALLLSLAVGLVSHHMLGDPDTDRALLVFAALMGLAVAAATAVPSVVVTVFAALTGLAIGMSSGPADVQGAARWVLLAGTFFGATLACVYVASMVTLAKQAWLHIAVRVLGSWLAAAALLVLALSFAARRG